MGLVHEIGDALLMAIGMAWQTGWSLVLGFLVSAVLQTIVPADQMRAAMGSGRPRDIALASLLGAASSSCSYASAAIMRTLFKRGAALVTALAFMVASTNLVLELGIVLYVLMGWPFTLGEWLGGVVMVAILSLVVKATYPTELAEAARRHPEAGGGHDHGGATVPGRTWLERLRHPETRIRVAQAFAMEWSMLWKDLAIGFGVGGLVAALVPDAFWKALFLQDASPWLKVPLDAVIGPLIAAVTFVCSIGNVPLAAVLWAGGASFGGVLAFLYADLIVLPLLDVYRRYFGWRMAAYIAAVLFVSMAAAAIVVDLLFGSLGFVPSHAVDVRAELQTFAINHTFWLNLLFGALAAYLFFVNRRHPPTHAHHCCGHGGHHHHAGAHAHHEGA